MPIIIFDKDKTFVAISEEEMEISPFESKNNIALMTNLAVKRFENTNIIIGGLYYSLEIDFLYNALSHFITEKGRRLNYNLVDSIIVDELKKNAIFIDRLTDKGDLLNTLFIVNNREMYKINPYGLVQKVTEDIYLGGRVTSQYGKSLLKIHKDLKAVDKIKKVYSDIARIRKIGSGKIYVFDTLGNHFVIEGAC